MSTTTPDELLQAAAASTNTTVELLPKPSSNGNGKAPPPTDAELVEAVRSYAQELYEAKVPIGDRLPMLRLRIRDLGLPNYRDDELQKLMWDARRKAIGTADGLGEGDVLDVAPTRWCWEGIVMKGCLNLLVAMPKQGKTLLMLGFISAWHQGRGEFLGFPLVGHCPPVLIVGPDMPPADWAEFLKLTGLMEDDNLIRRPIIRLFHQGTPIHLDLDGIAQIAAKAEEHPGLLILVDSLRKLTAGMGLKEESAEIANPVHDLMEAVAPFNATVVLIHHSGKGRAASNGVDASSGTTALPAAASQVIQLKPGDPSQPLSPTKILATEGRAKSVEVLVEFGGGTWHYLGTTDALKAEQARAAAEEKLNDRQAEALEVVRKRHKDANPDSVRYTTSKDLVRALQLTGADPLTVARRTLQQLKQRGFLQSKEVATAVSSEIRFIPVEGSWSIQEMTGGGGA